MFLFLVLSLYLKKNLHSIYEIIKTDSRKNQQHVLAASVFSGELQATDGNHSSLPFLLQLHWVHLPVKEYPLCLFLFSSLAYRFQVKQKFLQILFIFVFMYGSFLFTAFQDNYPPLTRHIFLPSLQRKIFVNMSLVMIR